MYVRPVRHPDEDRGASAVEYGLMVAAIAAIIVGVVFGLGRVVSTAFDHTCQQFGSQVQPGCKLSTTTNDGTAGTTTDNGSTGTTDTGAGGTTDNGAIPADPNIGP